MNACSLPQDRWVRSGTRDEFYIVREVRCFQAFPRRGSLQMCRPTRRGRARRRSQRRDVSVWVTYPGGGEPCAYGRRFVLPVCAMRGPIMSAYDPAQYGSTRLARTRGTAREWGGCTGQTGGA